MDMAMADIRPAREYLDRHGIQGLWEDCASSLITKRPQGKDAITANIIADVEAAAHRRLNPTKKVIFVLSHDGSKGAYVDDTARALGGECSVFEVPASANADAVAALVNTAPSAKVVVLGFPSSLREALRFEARHMRVHCVLLETTREWTPEHVMRAKAEDTPEGATARRYIEAIHPMVEYFSVDGRLHNVAAGADSASQVLQQALE